jgi:hypothetical protein
MMAKRQQLRRAGPATMMTALAGERRARCVVVKGVAIS